MSTLIIEVLVDSLPDTTTVDVTMTGPPGPSGTPIDIIDGGGPNDTDGA